MNYHIDKYSILLYYARFIVKIYDFGRTLNKHLSCQGIIGVFNPMAIDKTLHSFQILFMMFICLILGLIAYFNEGIG